MESKQVQLYLDREKMIEASPVTSAECVILSDGNDLQKVLDNDLTTPTVVHEETSFKVGQGDIDVSGSVVDGEVGRMVIKGQTYQNILPEPSLRNSMANGKTMQKLNEGYESVNTVDGVCKSAILTGQTLVNKASIVERIIANDGWNNLSVRLNYPLSANAKYLINIFNLPNDMKYVLTNRTSNSNWIMPSYVNEKTVFTSQCNSDSYITLHINSASSLRPLTQEEINKIQVILIEYQEGMENWDIPYFEGMQSVKMPVLTTIGENLFDVSKATHGYITSTGEINTATSNVKSDYIKINPSDNYSVKSWGALTGGNFSFYDNNKNFILRSPIVSTVTSPSNASYMVFHTQYVNGGEVDLNNVQIMIIKGSIIPTKYEPFKSNILTVNEDVTLRGIGDVRDELDLLTGEFTSRIGEVSTSLMTPQSISKGTNTSAILVNYDSKFTGWDNQKIICDKLKKVDRADINWDNTSSINGINISPTGFWIIVPSTITTKEQANEYLNNLNATIQYQLTTESVKTVDLSTSGNWEKVVLDGSENWTTGNDNLSSVYRNYVFLPNSIHGVNLPCFVNDSNFPNIVYGENKQGVVYGADNRAFYVFSDKKKYPTLESFKKYLQQNPMTVWYQTQTHQDSTQVKQPIFFKDGHIQLSSEVDNSLIPTLDYQAKTSNSYVMDLMKTNTKYTMKAKSASGTFTIDGTSYGAGTNGTFTSPTSMTNKLLVMSNKTNEEVMILEGDVTSKAIPYFKGIKSAFEDESKIEVLSTGKNLFDMNRRYDKLTNAQATVVQDTNQITVSSAESGTYVNANFILDKDLLKGKTVTGSCLYESDEKSIGTVQINYADSSGKWYYQQITRPRTFTFPNDFMGDVLLCVYANNTNTSQSNTVTVKNIQLEFGTKSTPYEPYKSNNTKIPLLSPLRSLPNGVCDELIIDRMKKKATLIQRVGHVMLDGSEEWGVYPTMEQDKTLLFQSKADCKQGKSSHCVSDRFPYSGSLWNSGFDGEGVMMGGGGSTYKRVDLRIYKGKVSSNNTTILREYLSKNPVTVYYELATPVITEVDLEGFPYVYKDGHIFLNSEIAPVVEINYNINQSQQIQSNNETLQRHELDILDLDNLIVSFVDCEYRLKLLAFNIQHDILGECK